MAMAVLDLSESKKLAKKYGVKFARSQTVKNERELKEAVKKLGFPLALKIVSEKIVHKTEAGGVKLGLRSEKEALKAFKELKKLEGFKAVEAQEMAEGTELIVGGKTDPQFGPVVLFGLGGIFVEILKDVSLRICPLTRQDAREMIKEIKGYKILKGARGREPVDLKALEDCLLKVCRMMREENIEELDLNPLMASGKSLKAIDARVVR